MDRLNGVYAGSIVSLGDGNATAFVPQVFGDTTIVISDFLVTPVIGRGWVSFQAGDPEFPVWLSGAASSVSGGGGGDGGSGFTYTQDTAPPPPIEVGDTWFNTSSGYSYVWVDDGTSQQWVQFAPGEGGSPTGEGLSFVHNQAVAASTWTITHELGWFPNVTVIDSGGATVEGDLAHVTSSQLRLVFSGAFTGTAYLS